MLILSRQKNPDKNVSDVRTARPVLPVDAVGIAPAAPVLAAEIQKTKIINKSRERKKTPRSLFVSIRHIFCLDNGYNM